jgi:hypothetical protein
MDKETRTRIENLEKQVARLMIRQDEGVPCVKEPVVEMDLVLPEADIDGLHFNKTTVHAVFELKEDGWYHSRDVLFLSARNSEDYNNRDILSEYLNEAAIEQGDGLKNLIANKMGVADCGNIEILLPREIDGVKQYNGADCWYWLKGCYARDASSFCAVHYHGDADYTDASSVGGCAPMFRVGR